MKNACYNWQINKRRKAINDVEDENNNIDDEKHWNIFDNTSMMILYHSSSTSLHASHFLSALLAVAMPRDVSLYQGNERGLLLPLFCSNSALQLTLSSTHRCALQTAARSSLLCPSHLSLPFSTPFDVGQCNFLLGDAKSLHILTPYSCLRFRFAASSRECMCAILFRLSHSIIFVSFVRLVCCSASISTLAFLYITNGFWLDSDYIVLHFLWVG